MYCIQTEREQRVNESFIIWVYTFAMPAFCTFRGNFTSSYMLIQGRSWKATTKRIFSPKTWGIKMREKRIKCALKLENRKWRFSCNLLLAGSLEIRMDVVMRTEQLLILIWTKTKFFQRVKYYVEDENFKSLSLIWQLLKLLFLFFEN